MSLISASLVLGFGYSTAQTSPEECALNILNLISPLESGMTVQLSREGRFGAVVQWADLDDAVTTCAVPVSVDDDGFSVTLDGYYKDIVDRQLNFFAPVGGAVGSRIKNKVLFQWSNANLQFTGQISGEVNLSNNGGLLVYDSDLAQWVQVNDGLPMHLGQTDVQAFAASPVTPGRWVAGLEDRLTRGLWYKPSYDEAWRRIGNTRFPDGSLQGTRITVCAFSPDNADVFLVGTSDAGLFLTRDGGQNFQQLQTEFTAQTSWSNFTVTDIDWSHSGEILIAITGLGLYQSTDDLATFQLFDALLVRERFPPAGESVPPYINDILNVGNGRILVAVRNYGVYQSLNGGEDWAWRWTQILGQPVAINATSLAMDPLDDQSLLAGTRNYGLFHSDDGGGDWTQVAPFDPEYPDEEPEPGATIVSVSWSEELSLFVAVTAGRGITTSPDGLTWSDNTLPQPGILTLRKSVMPGSGQYPLLVASYGGGIYQPGSVLRITDTIKENLTEPRYRNLEFGLGLSFSEGVVDSLANFKLVMQDFQGYAVWRSEVGAEDDMQLIGVYDKNNPESCIEGYCGDTSFYHLPNCYVDKRAACFDFSDPDTVRFFDDNIYDGFVYLYAVTTFDYGNTATSSPTALSAEQLYSPRYFEDELSYFDGPGNRMQFAVNLPSQPEAGGEEIYVFPNPLRNTSKGFTQADEGVEVNFVNLPPESRIRIFTVNGDLVGDLGPELQVEHSMKWFTRNTEGELLASGVYIYKVEMPRQDDYFGKLVIIR